MISSIYFFFTDVPYKSRSNTDRTNTNFVNELESRTKK